MKRVSIITTFASADEAYSLNRVVQDQIKMFVASDYKIKVIVHEGFKPIQWYEHPLVEIITIPNVPVSNETKVDKTFDEDVEKLENAFKTILEETDVAITHDIIYQPAAIKHNLALRNVIKKNSEIKTNFLHWIHSATKPSILSGLRGGGSKYLSLMNERFPRSLYIAFNSYSIPRIASWFNIEEGFVKYVPHPHDFLEGKCKLAQEIIFKNNLLEKDVLCLYPCRLDRGKQPEVVIKIMNQVKETGRSICCMIGDFHSTAGDKVTYREEMKNMARDMGMTPTELIFLSEFDRKEPIYELPHQVMTDLFDITNVFILPSRSETYSLVAQEAAAKRNLLILNQDFPPFRSIYGDFALYRQFSSNIDALTGMDGDTTTTYSDETGYYRDIATYINYVMENTRVMAGHNMIRKDRNIYHVFRKYIEPLLMVEPGKYNY